MLRGGFIRPPENRRPSGRLKGTGLVRYTLAQLLGVPPGRG
jgi:hypothetical protein